MGGLGVWAVAVALLGTSGCWLAEGHRSNKRASAGTAEAATQNPRSTVNVREPTPEGLNAPGVTYGYKCARARRAKMHRHVPSALLLCGTARLDPRASVLCQV